jgi:predicted nuclease of predicted toxin-antitoxin system
VRFVIDAQLPKRLIDPLASAGHQAIHTTGLPQGNRTTDDVVGRLADDEQSVLVTKDGDFVNSHLLFDTPRKLLLITTGNMGNKELFALFEHNLPAIVAAFEIHRFIELSASRLIIHD